MTQEKMKTGTTCIGLLFKGGVMLAADRRVTTHKIESDSFTKIFDISKNILATVAGMASDAQLFMRVIKGEIKLLELKNERQVKVREAAMILNSFQYSAVRSSGSVVGLIVGGYDVKEGYSLYDLSPDGTISSHDGYVMSGSGSSYVKSLFDVEYNSNLSEKDALTLVEKSYKVSFKNDNASGGGFIIKIVTKDGIKEISRKVVKTEYVEE
ncbi:MAG: hypothetical protein PF569_06920 [Candidatus Woesearchaeota archaeon]|jgi:20S proteasome alpha/beta subunit|nr:hypothetical protein [Candidatus Woesearchaeota archaeon]